MKNTELLLYPFIVPNLKYLRKLIRKGVRPSEIKYSILHDSIYLKKFGLQVSKNQNLFVLEGIDMLVNLTDQAGAQVKVDENGRLVIGIQSLELPVRSFQELEIMHEIYFKGIYNVQISGEYILIDIGMNVGMTSLYFASRANVLGVYAYEPFEETFKLGQMNIRGNSEVSRKIHAFNYGIGGQSEELTVDYLPEFRGSVGVKGIPPRFVADTLKQSLSKKKIRIRRADEVVREVRAVAGTTRLVAKIDCEGSEYEILRLLDSQSLLQEFCCIMLEWHEKGPGDIIEVLERNGFCCFSFEPHRKDIGMIYAVHADRH